MTRPPDLLRPSPVVIKIARTNVGLTQAEAARLVHLSGAHGWSHYETGARRPAAYRWELFLLLTDQHPFYRVTRKRAPASGPAACNTP